MQRAQLYSICQRYNFESNLQLVISSNIQNTSCIRYVKDTILKAIYNSASRGAHFIRLYSICQRYNFESNLQRVVRRIIGISRCIRYVKDTILKAIYNDLLLIYLTDLAVFDMSKIQF